MEIIDNNISYTNMDFPAMYSELLQLVPKLTDKWDPTESDEADPGVVLLKSKAIIGDKNNYYIDKNILELFPSTVTQYANAKEIFALQGYYMHWYKSAICDLTIKWIGEVGDNAVTLPAFTTMFTTEDNAYVYTLVKDISIPETGVSVKLSLSDNYIIEGKCQQYLINGISNITIDNLDSNNRLYFMDSNIPENGIFVRNTQNPTKYWESVDNLEATAFGSTVYKFGVTADESACYIEFPQDIGNLIGSGLSIDYIITSGSAGKVKSGEITKLFNSIQVSVDTQTITIDNDNLGVFNADSSTAGSDPESIDEANDNYKHTIGTFNTLVTERDYENYILKFRNTVVSNAVVSDRTDDLNSSYNVCTLTPSEENVQLYQTKDSAMTAYDLKLYALNAVSNITDATSYNNSFLSDGSTEYLVQKYLNLVPTAIMHDFISTTVQNDFGYLFKNYYPLTGKVITYNKVSAKEASTIEKNINTALFENFNAAKINFGDEIDYDAVVNTIQNADKNIKYVVLDDITYDPVKLVTFDNSKNRSEAVLITEQKNSIIAKSILAGKTQGIKYATTIQQDFGQAVIDTSSPVIIDNIKTISTETEITVTNTATKLLDNESIKLYAPNFIDKKIYSNYLYYKADGLTADVSIAAGSYYLLPTNASISFYEDSAGKNLVGTISQNEIIRVSADTILYKESMYTSLGTDSITQVAENKIDLSNILGSVVNCYWITKTLDTSNNNTVNCVLFPAQQASAVQSYLLKDGEYFLYTDKDKTTLEILGSGTLITRTPNTTSTIMSAMEVPQLDLANIAQLGVSGIDWFTDTTTFDLTVLENQIIDLGVGTEVIRSGDSNIELTNDPTTICDALNYRTNDTDNFTALPELPTNMHWQGFSNLSIVASDTTPVVLSNSRQSITLTPTTSTTGTLYKMADNSKPIYIKFSNPVVIAGGENIDASVLNDDGTYSYTLSSYAYNVETEYTRNADNYIALDVSKSAVNLSLILFKETIIPIFVESGEITLATTTSNTIKVLGTTNLKIKNRDFVYSLKCSNNDNTYPVSITITASLPSTASAASMLLGLPQTVSEDISDSIQQKITALDTNNVFNYTKIVDPETNISDPTDSISFFNPNHIYNKYIIPQIDTSQLSIKVSTASKIRSV